MPQSEGEKDMGASKEAWGKGEAMDSLDRSGPFKSL